MRSLVERLGFEVGDRVAIVHADDIGMCHAANVGAFEALAGGPVTCGSIMVPCPWFSEAAERARAHPELDLGVHLTLTAEWARYRWGPVSSASAVPSLLDEQGVFPRTVADVLLRAKSDEVETELRAQIERALESGIDVTHLDAHMGVAFGYYREHQQPLRGQPVPLFPQRLYCFFILGHANRRCCNRLQLRSLAHPNTMSILLVAFKRYCRRS